MDKTKYYLVKKKALPEVLLKVAEVKRMITADENMTVQEATEKVGLSRSSFYKYKDDILPFHEHEKGQTITILIQAEDRPGILADVLQTIARYSANILTIHQSIPVDGIATLSLSLEVLSTTGNLSDMLEELEEHSGVFYLKILGRELAL